MSTSKGLSTVSVCSPMMPLRRIKPSTFTGPPGDRFRVPCRALDDMHEWFEPEARVTGIKVDTENYEADVLEGGRRLLLTHRPLVYCELWLTPNRDRAVALMRELGFDALVHRDGRLDRFEPWPHASAQDFFFVPQTSA